jgi:hypothetical protein
MDSKKVVIVVLILIVVAFVILAVYGGFFAEPSKSLSADQAIDDSRTAPTPDWIGSLSSIFGGWQEAVDLPCKLPSTDPQRLCDGLAPSLTIGPAKEPWLPLMKRTMFRPIKLVLIDGQGAHITYFDKGGFNNIKNPQTFDLPDPDNKSPQRGSIVAMERGGTLTIQCLNNSPCKVGQE